MIRPVPPPRLPSGAPPLPLVGREAELRLLQAHLDGAGPPLLLLTGEPGIGKSRLLQEAVRHAGAPGWTVIEGGCQRRGSQEPYAPLLGALQRHMAGQAPIQLRADLRSCAWLVRLLPELVDGPIAPLPSWTLPPEQERRLMFAAVARFLANVSGPAGTLLVLDDLQWAERDALDLLRAILHDAPPTRLRLIGAYRDTEVGAAHPLAVAAADLAHAGLAAQHALAPLAPQEAARLLEQVMAGTPVVGARLQGDPALRERLLRHAGGIPFFLLSYAQGVAESAPGQREALPWTVAQSIRQRVAALPEEARDALGAAAVVGRVADRALLTALIARPEGEALAALAAVCQAGLLEEEGEHAYRFAHDAIREVVEADLGAARRTLLHRRVAEALEHGGERPIDLLAYHYARSDAQDAALRYLEQAADDAWARHANAAAAGYYGDLVDRLDARGRHPDSIRAREKLGVVLATMGQYDAALATLERAVDLCRAVGDGAGLERVAAQIGRVHAARETPAAGILYLRSLLESLEASGVTRGVAALYVGLAHLYHVSYQRAEELAAATRAVELARSADDQRLVAEAQWLRGAALGHLGRGEDALRVLEDAACLAEAAGDPVSLMHALIEAAFVCQHQGAFGRSKRYNDRALAAAERQGDPSLLAHATANRAVTALVTGHWDQAWTDFQHILALRRAIGLPDLYAPAFLGSLCLLRGATDEASHYLEESLASARENDDIGVLRFVHGLLAERDLLDGRPDEAYERLAPLLALPEEPHKVFDNTFLLKQLAWICVERGDTDQAADAVARALAQVRGRNDRIGLVEVLRVQALVWLAQGRWEEARGALEEGLTLTRRMPYPHVEGRLLHVYGLLHRARGEPGPAHERFEAALRVFRRLGARTDAERTEQALGSLPGAPAREAAQATGGALPARQGRAAGTPIQVRQSARDRQAWALEHLRAAGSLSPRAYAQALDVSVDTALRDLRELANRGLVQAAGTTRDRRYMLADAVDDTVVGACLRRITR